MEKGKNYIQKNCYKSLKLIQRCINFSQYLFRRNFPRIIKVYLTNGTSNFFLFLQSRRTAGHKWDIIPHKDPCEQSLPFFLPEHIPEYTPSKSSTILEIGTALFNIGIFFFISLLNLFMCDLMAEKDRIASNPNIFPESKLKKSGKHYCNFPIGSFPAHSKKKLRVKFHNGNSIHRNSPLLIGPGFGIYKG